MKKLYCLKYFAAGIVPYLKNNYMNVLAFLCLTIGAPLVGWLSMVSSGDDAITLKLLSDLYFNNGVARAMAAFFVAYAVGILLMFFIAFCVIVFINCYEFFSEWFRSICAIGKTHIGEQ